MKRIKLVVLGLLALITLGIMTATSAPALTLPDVHVVLGGTYPIVAEGELVSRDIFETITGSKIENTLVKLQLSIKELSSLGLFTADFTGFKEKAQPCKTSGDAKETVLTWGEFHLAVDGTKTKEVIIFLPSGFTIVCGEPEKTKIKLKGAWAGIITAKLTTELTTFGGILEGTKGKNNVTSYLNDKAETVTKVFLESEFGLGYEQSMESVTGEISLRVAGGQMIEILP